MTTTSAVPAVHAGGPADGDAPAARTVALSCMVGTTIEWYDFYLYATAAALVLKPLFFPSVSPTAGTLASFATYAVSFGARPVGAVIAGHLGTGWGARPSLSVRCCSWGWRPR